MCRRVTCKQCGKATWAGCGAHVEQVLGDVPRDQRCSCAADRAAAKAAQKAVTGTAPAAGKPTILERLGLR